MIRTASLALALSLLTGTALAQTPSMTAADRPTIIVMGSGEASRLPDWGRVAFQVRGEGATSVAALQSLTTQRAQMAASLKALKGVARLDITDGTVSTQDVRGRSCGGAQPYVAAQQLSQGECAITGVIATIETQVQVWPAAKVGDVVSLATQLGGKMASLRGAGLEKDDALRAEAARSAVLDARRQAEAVAAAAGMRLGKVVRLQDASANAYTPVIVSGSAVAPPPPLPLPPTPAPVAQSVTLAYRPQPITRSARVAITYELQP